MNRITIAGLSAAISLALALSFANAGSKKVEIADVDGSNCSISPTTFSTWFQSGSLGKDGTVTFADSVNFPVDNTKCDFYKWGHQMFLWMLSPSAGGIVLDSPVFFDVNFNSSGNAVYLPNTLGEIDNSFDLRGTKPQNFQPGGQAGGSDTLLSLKDSLVYFGIHANDVYAWFNTAVSNGVLPATTPFPSTQAELDAIVNYATSNGAVLPDANALTLELKTAWVDGATVDDLSKYVTISADVPNYVKTSDTLWTIDSTAPTVQKTLALVGMHVVGPVQGHPEMVWATFEHRDNVPDNTFYFDSIFGQVQVPYDASGTWNFMTDGGSQDGALTPQMTIDGSTGNVKATTGNTIRQNNVYRVNPWGNAPVPASAENNSQLISLNLDIGLMLALTGDVRANYFQVGSVWTRDGSIPSSPTDPELIGSLLLANSSMETYHQTGPGSANMGCFGCHSADSSTGTSHLFSASNQPLVAPSARD